MAVRLSVVRQRTVVARLNRREVAWISGAAVCGLLAWFKMPGGGRWMIPIGFSYLAFELLHVTIERRRGRIASVSFVDMLAYALFQFFVQLLDFVGFALDFAQCALSLAVQARVVDAQGGAACQICGEAQITVGIPAGGTFRGEGNRPECPVSGNERYDHCRSQAQFLQDFEVFGILRQSDEHGIGNIRVDLRFSRAHHVRDAVWGSRFCRELLLELSCPIGS